MAILITGASAGFGAAMCKRFAQAGFPVIGLARRTEKLDLLKQEIQELTGKSDLFHGISVDMRDKESINQALAQLKFDLNLNNQNSENPENPENPESNSNQESNPENNLNPHFHFNQIDLLINNAGLALGLEPAHQADFADWENMIQTNIIGLTYLTRQILPQMVENKRGYVINIGSIAGTYPYPGGNVYGATKAYVRQFSLNLRADLHGTGVRVSNIEPGLCGGSEFSNVRFKGDDERASKLYENVDFLTPEDIAETAFWLYQTPAHLNINSLEVMPVAQSFNPLNVYRKPVLPDNSNNPNNQSNQDNNQENQEQGFLGKLASLFK